MTETQYRELLAKIDNLAANGNHQITLVNDLAAFAETIKPVVAPERPAKVEYSVITNPEDSSEWSVHYPDNPNAKFFITGYGMNSEGLEVPIQFFEDTTPWNTKKAGKENLRYEIYQQVNGVNSEPVTIVFPSNKIPEIPNLPDVPVTPDTPEVPDTPEAWKNIATGKQLFGDKITLSKGLHVKNYRSNSKRAMHGSKFGWGLEKDFLDKVVSLGSSERVYSAVDLKEVGDQGYGAIDDYPGAEVNCELSPNEVGISYFQVANTFYKRDYLNRRTTPLYDLDGLRKLIPRATKFEMSNQEGHIIAAGLPQIGNKPLHAFGHAEMGDSNVYFIWDFEHGDFRPDVYTRKAVRTPAGRSPDYHSNSMLGTSVFIKPVPPNDYKYTKDPERTRALFLDVTPNGLSDPKLSTVGTLHHSAACLWRNVEGQVRDGWFICKGGAAYLVDMLTAKLIHVYGNVKINYSEHSFGCYGALVAGGYQKGGGATLVSTDFFNLDLSKPIQTWDISGGWMEHCYLGMSNLYYDDQLELIPNQEIYFSGAFDGQIGIRKSV